jgi:hypothetical protein
MGVAFSPEFVSLVFGLSRKEGKCSKIVNKKWKI